MFKTLPDTPCTWLRSPVELLWIEPDHQFFSPFIRGIQFGDESNRPRGQSSSDWCRHCSSIPPQSQVTGNRPQVTGKATEKQEATQVSLATMVRSQFARVLRSSDGYTTSFRNGSIA